MAVAVHPDDHKVVVWLLVIVTFTDAGSCKMGGLCVSCQIFTIYIYIYTVVVVFLFYEGKTLSLLYYMLYFCWVVKIF